MEVSRGDLPRVGPYEWFVIRLSEQVVLGNVLPDFQRRTAGRQFMDRSGIASLRIVEVPSIRALDPSRSAGLVVFIGIASQARNA